ncbi:glycosyltransferase involved in cell wall biosynthesis [Rahnella sp. BIGb0236]|uniref:glycosyltransferase n=1 Tax=Rahnella sp. BIGb0236 TaxID=2485117 RepID=UPI0010EC3B95|nr:glycosyltransferase [Rahnella sp. BIGb0236]TDS88336.1 glycosyltransferase involved in cell wall biosynthesis [Rahnella sp. BIGb0236]VTQ62298.1 family 2 glycosyl transferase [Campylobacter jejuni]
MQSIDKKRKTLLPNSDVKVSVCCITYNQELYVADAIEGFLSQKTNFPFEIIISDDGSTDETSNIIDSYVTKYPGLIRYVKTKRNLGANGNLLNAVSHAKGAYIAFCEGDDYWIDDKKIQKQYDAMIANPDVMFSFHPCFLLKGESVSKVKSYSKGELISLFTVDDVLKSLNQFAPTASYMFNKEMIGMLPEWFNNAPVGDLFLELYGMKNSGGLYLPWPMSVYRLQSQGSWSAHTQKQSEAHTTRHLAIIESLKKSSEDFHSNKLSFLNKISHIYLALAIRAIKSGDVIGFRKYLAILEKNSSFMSSKYSFYKKFRNKPWVLFYLHKIKSFIFR